MIPSAIPNRTGKSNWHEAVGMGDKFGDPGVLLRSNFGAGTFFLVLCYAAMYEQTSKNGRNLTGLSQVIFDSPWWRSADDLRSFPHNGSSPSLQSNRSESEPSIVTAFHDHRIQTEILQDNRWWFVNPVNGKGGPFATIFRLTRRGARHRCDGRHRRCFYREVTRLRSGQPANREEKAMSVHRRKDADQPPRTSLAPLDRDRRPATGVMGNDWRSKSARWRGFIPPTIDQDRLTLFLLMTIMVLSALNFMLRFPDLGAVIAQYNQF